MLGIITFYEAQRRGHIKTFCQTLIKEERRKKIAFTSLYPHTAISHSCDI